MLLLNLLGGGSCATSAQIRRIEGGKEGGGVIPCAACFADHVHCICCHRKGIAPRKVTEVRIRTCPRKKEERNGERIEQKEKDRLGRGSALRQHR